MPEILLRSPADSARMSCSVSVVLVSRMMLHLREEASARSDSDNEGIRLATISWARTNLSRTQQGSATSASELLHDERTEERA